MNQTYIQLVTYLTNTSITPQLAQIFEDDVDALIGDGVFTKNNKLNLESWIWEHQGQQPVVDLDTKIWKTLYPPTHQSATFIYSSSIIGETPLEFPSWALLNDHLSILDRTKNEWNSKSLPSEIEQSWDGWNYIKFTDKLEGQKILVNFEGLFTIIQVWDFSAGEYITRNLYEVYKSQELQDMFDSVATDSNPITLSWDGFDIRSQVRPNYGFNNSISLNYPGGIR